jgi:type I restriction enzyme S subunit
MIDYNVSVTAKSIESYKVVEIGDFIISLRSFQGGIEYSNYLGLCSPAYIILREKTDIIKDFYRHYFKSFPFIKDLNKNLEGIRDGKMISYKQFSEIFIPKPPIQEQQKIASCLSSLDELIEAHSQKLELLKDHKKGLMQNLFPQEGEKMPKFRFEEFEGEWEEKKLGELSENIMYGMNAAATDYDGKSKYLRITDIDEDSRAFNLDSVTSPNGKLEEKYLVRENDILFARTGASVGKSYLYNKNDGIVFFAGFLIRFNIQKADSYFIFQQTLTEKFRDWVSITSTRSGQPGINAEEYKSFLISVPPTKKEQQKIASTLSSLDELITAQAEKIEQLKEHKKGLMQGLFPKMNE